jgi:hypothetical protein
MRSLQRRFSNIAMRNPYWSSYYCLAEAVKNQQFSRKIITKHFNNLVDKDDYDKVEKRNLINHLFSLSQRSKR